MKSRKAFISACSLILACTNFSYFAGSALNFSNVILLQSALFGKAQATLSENDLNHDSVLNGFDFALAKRQLFQSQVASGYNALKINEVCATNKTNYIDTNGTTPDWVEIYNSGDKAIDLSGVGLSDGEKNLYKFTFPENTILNPDGYLLVLCDEMTEESGYHANFKISASGETIRLTAPDGTAIDVLEVPETTEDETYGRYYDGTDNLQRLSPTPNASNNTASTVYKVEKPLFSQEAGFYDSEFALTLSTEQDCKIIYTLDGSDPRTSDTAKTYSDSIRIYDNTSDKNVLSAYSSITLYQYQAPSYNVDKGIVVRAVCVDNDGNYGNVVTNGYYINKNQSYYKDMKVISISTDAKNFMDDDTGIYVIGNNYYNQSGGGQFGGFGGFGGWGFGGLQPGDSKNPTNYNQQGSEWERPCNIQVFESGVLKYTEDVGVRISGGWSTANPQKSLTFYARSEYGNSKMKYDFFEGNARDTEGKKIKEYKKVTLRNGGNSYDNARFRDELIQECAEGLNMSTQAKYDYVVFIDGEFWGYYAMQEKLDENYVESHYNVDKKNVTTFKNGTSYEGDESIYQEYVTFWNWAMSADMSKSENYQKVCDTIDVEGYMDYVALQSYIANWDCLVNPNNWMIWRANTVDADNPYADGKWRFMLFDTEFSTGYSTTCGVNTNYFEDMDQTGKIASLGSLFYKLMNNQTFKNQFYTRCMKVYQENYETNKTVALTESYTSKLTEVMNATFKRWGVTNSFESSAKVVRNFFSNREKYAISYLNNICGKSSQTISVDNMIDQYSWDLWMDGGVGNIEYEDDGSVTAVITQPGEYTQLSAGGLKLEQGKTYEITYTVKANVNVQASVQFQENADDYTSYYYQQRSIGTNPQTYTDRITMNVTDKNAKFLFTFSTPGTYTVSNYKMVCVN